MLSTPGAFPAPSAYTGGGVGYSGLSAGPFASSPGTSATAGAGAAGGGVGAGGGGGGGGNGSNPPLTGGPGVRDVDVLPLRLMISCCFLFMLDLRNGDLEGLVGIICPRVGRGRWRGVGGGVRFRCFWRS